jgi:outer membrane receptor for ferrienterochelin and colicins
MRNIQKYTNSRFIFIFLILWGLVALNPAGSINAKDPKYKKTIEGIVIDEDNNWIAGAEVIIPEKNIYTKTNEIGKFFFEILGGGAIHVEVFKEGYMPITTEVIKIKKRVQIKVPQIVLRKTLMEEVVVTGTATPKLYRETPVKTFVATKETIEKSGAQNLADSLELVTGVRVEDNCQNCNFTEVRINGMEGKYCQILFDGKPMVSALAGVYALEQIPANLIEKFEVVKGGGSSLYGGNAIGGVVNVILKEATKSGALLSLDQGLVNGESNTNVNFNYDYVAKNRQTQASLFSNYQRREPMDYNDDDFSDLGELTNLSLGSNFSHYFNNLKGKLKLGFVALSEDRRGGNKFDQPEHYADIAESIKTKRLDFSAAWEQTFSQTSILKVNGAYSFTKRNSYYGVKKDPNAYGYSENPVFYGEVQYYNFSLNQHAIITGLSYKSDTVDDRAPAYSRIIDETFTDLGFYLQDEISLGKKLKILLGARADKHSEIEKMIVSPRVSIGFNGITDVTLRFTYSTGFRAPQVFDEDLHITQVGGEGMVIRNRDGLKEEKSYSLTLGMDFGKQTKNKLYQLSFGAFYNRLNNVFTLDEVEEYEDYMLMERFNGDGAKIYGLEFELGFKHASGFEFFTGWTWQKSEYDSPEPDFNSTKMFRTPEFYGILKLDWDIKRFLVVITEFNYTGPMKVPHYAGYIPDDVLETSDSFAVINFKLGKEFKATSGRKFTVTASLLNVFDSFQKDLDKGVYRDAGYIYGPRFPRTFRIGVKYNF